MHGSTDRLCMDIKTEAPTFGLVMLRCNIFEFPRRLGVGRVSRCFGTGSRGPGARPGQGSSDPTSPRREASLFNLPGLVPGNFFVRAYLKEAGGGAKPKTGSVARFLIQVKKARRRGPADKPGYSQAISRASAARVKRTPSWVVLSDRVTPLPFCISRVESPAPMLAPTSPEV